MQYDTSIDDRILTALSKSNTRHFNNLYYNVIESREGKIMSRSVLSFHLKKLMHDGLVDKYDHGQRGIRVNYFLTDFGKQQFILYPTRRQQEKERLERVYQLLFFFVSKYQNKGISQRLNSEEDLENFLARIHIFKGDLIVESIRNEDSGGMYPRNNKMYESKTVTEFKPLSGLKLWKEDYHNCTWFSSKAMAMSPYEIRHKRAYEIAHDDRGRIVLKSVRKKEIEEEIAIGREKVKIDDFSYYFYSLPIGGVSVLDVLDHRDFLFEHGGFTPEEVKEAFTILKKMGIFRPAGILFGEILYSFSPAHEPLKGLLNEYWELPGDIFAKMNRIWNYLRRSTAEERKWLELFYGEKDAAETLRSAYYRRHSYKRIAKGSISLEIMLKTFTDLSKEDIHEIIDKTTDRDKKRIIVDLQGDLGISINEIEYNKELILDFDKSIKKKIQELEEKYADVIQTYRFPLRKLRDMIYPHYIQYATYVIRSDN